MLISEKKKIESAAGLNNSVIFFGIVLNLRMVCPVPVVIFTQLFCTFAAHLYIVMLLQYFFMPAGW